MLRWLFAWSACCGAGCGGVSRSEQAAAEETPPRDCQGEACAGRPCVGESDCPSASLHYKSCLPSACALDSICHYAPITAGLGAPILTCSCDGRIEHTRIGAGSPPAVFAYRFPSELTYVCDCAPGEVCARSVCATAACDPTLDEAPTLSASAVGADLPWSDGVEVIAFDPTRQGEAANERLIVGRGTLSSGAFAFAVAGVGVRPTLLVDENVDGACNAGEIVLPYATDFQPKQGWIRWIAVADEPSFPCEDRLPSR